ncbi:MAG: Bug family tripartite tricarboxylate transporter substrate binding protein [bacterium]|jgi:tripartite-type tricarboxylate transporter receptor subunit TctC|nr:tripartite tricarboxylate transporter substrate binding protein [Betaproteobacteria bacterium]
MTVRTFDAAPRATRPAALFAVACALGMPGAPDALAQGAYPERPVRFIIPFAPGGAGDFVGRIVAARLAEGLGQPMVVDNRPGASGLLGVELGAASKPDGYTLVLGNNGAIVISPAIYATSTVRPARDLAAISQIVDVPSILVVHPSLPVKTTRQLVDLARKRPGELNFGSPGSASGNRLEMEVFRRVAGLDMAHIPYKGGAGPAVAALVAGETQLMFTTLSSVVPFVKAGRLRALALTSPARSEVLPEVPTTTELGLTELVGGSWQGLFFPKDVPGPILERVFGATVKALGDADVRRRLASGGAEVVVSASTAEFARYVAAETVKWGRVVKESGASAE